MSVPLHRAIPTPHTWKSEILCPRRVQMLRHRKLRSVVTHAYTSQTFAKTTPDVLKNWVSAAGYAVNKIPWLPRMWKFCSRNPLTLMLNEWHARSRRTQWTVAKVFSNGCSTSWRLIVALIWVRGVGFLVIVKKKSAPTLSRERIVTTNTEVCNN